MGFTVDEILAEFEQELKSNTVKTTESYPIKENE